MHKKFVVGILLLLTIPAFGDQVVLKNGDRLTGSITKSDGKVLVIKTDAAGDVTIKFDSIQSITSTGDLNVTLGGKTVVGPVTTNGDNVVVTTKTAGPVEAPKASVTLVRSPAEQAAYEKSLHPGLLEGWAGGLNLGFAVTAGNSETKSLNIAFNAARTGFHDKLVLYTNSIYATTSKPASLTTADTNGGGIRYDHDFSPRTFGFVSGDFFSNSLQDLSLRSILGGGYGEHVIKSPTTTLDLLAGLNYTHESFSDVSNPNAPPPPASQTYSPSDSSAALTLGDTFTHKLGKSTLLTQSFLFYPGLTKTSIVVIEPTPPNSSEDVRQYRGAFNLSTVTKINKWLGWQNSFGDVFVTHPPTVALGTPRIERNDVQFATGLNISFTH
ncbi:MAG: DUF481 domain-containing protein [Terriglobales bacterium]